MATYIPPSNNGTNWSMTSNGVSPNLPYLNTAHAVPNPPPPGAGFNGPGTQWKDIPIAPLPGQGGAGSWAI